MTKPLLTSNDTRKKDIVEHFMSIAVVQDTFFSRLSVKKSIVRYMSHSECLWKKLKHSPDSMDGEEM